MITVIGTYNNLPLSHLIRNATREPISHFAIGFDKRLVFHSNPMGSHPEWRATFEKRNTIYCEYVLPATLEQEEQVYLNIINRFDNKPYDVPALLFQGFVGYPALVMTGSFPKTNPWNNKEMLLCIEVAACLEPILRGIENINISAMTPMQVIDFIVKELKLLNE